MKMRGHIARGRSCSTHGDNGCEIRGCAGSLERCDEKRLTEREIADAFADYADESLELAQTFVADPVRF